MQVVERVVEKPVERVRMPRHDEWPDVLRELAAQLGDGRIYNRELTGLDTAVTDVVAALRRHLVYHRTTRSVVFG